ncbi:MAG TPA: sulfite exporter TauE/SafE family protein [Thiolapillus brandeum]|uniref:Probable membrane transporter protein n=1 Tax=Thiolapillus brandeum TaxID=1076588 RepID=A0A831NRQ9_9GAMM|nr:sulfite exporter TauE/SafE family protein [Thiolapillus brandeum]
MGIGGGLVVVPGLLLLFHMQDFAPAFLSHIAIGSSLAIIVPTALSSLWAHHQRGAVDWSVVLKLTPGLMLGAVAGAWLASLFSTDLLKILFGLFLFVVAFQMLSGVTPKSGRLRYQNSAMFLPVGALIGAVSGLVGIGGGTMTVPFLVWRGKPLPKAVATSAACGLPIAVAGAIGFMLMGSRIEMAAATGFVYWPAVLIVGLFAVLTAPLGAHLAHDLPVSLLKKGFALLLLVVGLRLLFSVYY